MKSIQFLIAVLLYSYYGFSQNHSGDIEKIFSSVAFITTTKIQTQQIEGNVLEVYLRNPKNNEIRPLTINEFGTGFFVMREVDYYLITAEHVANTTNASTSIVISLSDNSPFEIKLKDLVGSKYLDGESLKWIKHANADVALIPIDKSQINNLMKIHFYPYELILNKLESPLRQTNLVAYGYPLGLGIGKRISPISKKYSPSSGLIDLNRFDNNRPSTFFLVDDPSITGLSGGPVVALPQVLEYDDTVSIAINNPWLLGLVHGTINKDGGGYGAIVPSKFIAETIDLAPGYSGKYTYKYSDGKIWSEVIYKNGQAWEVISNFDRNGMPHEMGNLKNGSGTRFVYNEDGRLEFIRHYQNGIRIRDKRNSPSDAK